MNLTQRPPELSLEEKERILAVAEHLIRDPKGWTTGTWECPMYERDAGGEYVYDETGNPVRKTDANGTPLATYCIEGAVNEATLRVLGEDRAVKLGAMHYGPDGKLKNHGRASDLVGFSPTEILGLDDIAFELYAEEQGWDKRDYTRLNSGNIHRTAMAYNDGVGKKNRKAGHEGVLTILRTGLKRVRENMKSK